MIIDDEKKAYLASTSEKILDPNVQQMISGMKYLGWDVYLIHGISGMSFAMGTLGSSEPNLVAWNGNCGYDYTLFVLANKKFMAIGRYPELSERVSSMMPEFNNGKPIRQMEIYTYEFDPELKETVLEHTCGCAWGRN